MKLFYTVRYHYSVFFRKIRSLPPLVAWVLTLYLMYERPPVNVVQGFLSASMFLFALMVWFGYLFLSDFDTVTEHLLILQTNCRMLYAASKVVFLVTICLAVSIVGGFMPVIMTIAHHVQGVPYMPYGMRVADFFGGILLHFIAATLGVAVAWLFRPNHTNRSEGFDIVLMILFTIMAFVKHQIVTLPGVTRYVFVVFTPVYEIFGMFSEEAAFSAGTLALATLFGAAYFAVAMVVGYRLYKWRVYGPKLAG